MTRFDHDDDADLVAVIEDATQQAFRKGLDAGEAKGHAKGFADGQRALRDALAIVAKLNGSTHKVLKALEADEPPPPDDHLDAMPEDARRLLAAAMLDVAIKHAENDTDPTAGLGSLVDLAYDPGELQDLIDGGGDVIAKAFTSSVFVKAWDSDLHPRDDNGRFLSKQKLQEAKTDPKKAKELLARTNKPEERAKLEKVLAGKADPGHTRRSQARADAAGRRASREESAKRAYKIATDAMVGDASPEHFEELATHLPNLTVAQLKDIRAALGVDRKDRAKAAIVAKLVQHAAEKAKGETSKESSKPDASSDGYTTTPDAKPLHQMTIGEALESGVDYHDWHNAVTDAFRNEVTAEDDPIFHSLPKDLQTGTDYKRAQKLMGQQVIDSKGNEHTLTDIAPDLSHVILTDKAGKQAAYRMDDVHSVAGYVDHYIEGAKDGSLHPSNAERIAPHLAKEIVASGENMFTALKQRGVDPMSRGGKVLRDAVARQIEKIQAEKNKPSPERQRAMSRAVELQTAPEPTSVVDPSHEQDVQRGREADKKFRGDGRYESEIWQNLKRKNPGKPLPKLSKDAAEWTADEYERDGKPVPPEVLADYPDLAAKYAPKPATPESPPRAVEAKDDAARMERALDAMRRAGNPEEAAPAPVAATSAPAAPAPTPVASMSPKEFADAVHQIANAETRGYGNNKVFISDVFDGLKKRDPSLTLGEFKRRLLDAHGDRDLGLTLSRADLAQVMHPDDVSRSEIVHPHFSGVNFHFVQTPEQKPRTNRGPDGGIHSNPASVPSAPAPPPAAAFSASPTR